MTTTLPRFMVARNKAIHTMNEATIWHMIGKMNKEWMISPLGFEELYDGKSPHDVVINALTDQYNTINSHVREGVYMALWAAISGFGVDTTQPVSERFRAKAEPFVRHYIDLLLFIVTNVDTKDHQQDYPLLMQWIEILNTNIFDTKVYPLNLTITFTNLVELLHDMTLADLNIHNDTIKGYIARLLEHIEEEVSVIEEQWVMFLATSTSIQGSQHD